MPATASFTAEKNLSAYLTEGLNLLPQLPATDISLFSGKLGHVLLYAYTYKLTGEEGHWDHAMTCLDEVLDKLRNPAGSALISVPGVIPCLCYLLQVLSTDGITDIDLGTDTLRQLDEVVFRNTQANLQDRNIDFLYGSVGALNYLSTRLGHNPAAAGYLRILLQDLLAHKVEDARGVRFYNSHINRMNNSTDMNLGLAHGQCGLLLVLLKLYEAGTLQAEIRPVATGMLRYLLSLQLPPEPENGYHSFFPARFDDDIAPSDPLNRVKYNNRMGWCYGDLNVVLVLYRAARILQLPHLVALADEVGAYTCTRRTLEASGIENAHICHGSASLVMCYNALLREMPLACYSEAKKYWLHRTTTYLDEEYRQALTNKHAPGLLMGIPGMLLILVTEMLDTPTSWEQLFLF
ncbi:lanthionine synthetase LanC family protein [Hymenobacter swuensis]|uniref:Lanthionine synthetase C family protein n=1 Tax=Hymenobacter swuensis DY53 TaxID=1227739 RepID=W8EZM7_9BACT|nr:lanthionine synthetase LanC family protein [Hymenobacter swuensis]AHJ95791.1 hypothetical protein Hsw_0196 [Hymenobacter swuensis DY53]